MPRLIVVLLLIVFAGALAPAQDQAMPGSDRFPIYPGAQPKPEASGEHHDRGTLRLQTATPTRADGRKYLTADSAAAVVAFYQKELARLGNVQECTNGTNTAASVSVDEQTPQNLSQCRESEFGQGETGLKAGKPDDFTIVSVRANGSQTEITLVRVLKGRKAKAPITV